ncbi:MAG TPA: hypothetical protein VHU85_07535 [Acidimicrobiales bacterium]|jgi:hypothetical protein|nr:hypothetical protein [Acidimicrobiales bacterium]
MTPEEGNPDVPASGDGPEPDEEELLAGFDRLRPQGSLQWGFDDAMRRLSERGEGTGAAGVPWEGLPDDLWERGRSARIGQRFVGDVAGVLASILAADARAAADAAMDDRLIASWDALRYLAARLESLEARVDPVGDLLAGPPLPIPVPEVSRWRDAVAGWFESSDRTRPVIVGEAGTGALVAALEGAGHRVRGVEPRGEAVWSAFADQQIEDGVVLSEVAEFLAAAETASAAGVILVGAVDRLDLAAKLALLAHAVRVVGPGGTVALLVTDQSTWDETLPTVGRDLAPGRPLHPETWLYLLRRLGVVNPSWHRSEDGSGHALVGRTAP